MDLEVSDPTRGLENKRMHHRDRSKHSRALQEAYVAHAVLIAFDVDPERKVSYPQNVLGILCSRFRR